MKAKLPLVIGGLAAAVLFIHYSRADDSQFLVNPGAAASTDTAHQAVNPDWRLVWSDEFDGTTLDTTKWSIDVDAKGGGNGELQYYTARPENVRVEDGNLVLTAIKEDYTGDDGQKRHYTSGKVNTRGHADWKYGRMEARIKMPKGQGLWPAFWMMPSEDKYGGWAKSGEIDIAEVIGQRPNIVYGTLHYHDSWPRNQHTGDKFTLPSGDLSDDYHVYAIEWEPGVMRWYLDGNLYETQTKWDTVAAPFPAPFDQNFFFILNFAVGGAWPGKPNSSMEFPQKMLIDYVRVYQPVAKP